MIQKTRISVFFSFFILLASLIVSCSEDVIPKEPELLDKEFSLNENPVFGTLIGNIAEDQSQDLEYSIVAGDPNGAFAINTETGEIKVNKPEFIDFETAPTFELAVTVINLKSNLDAVATVTVNVQNVMEIPEDGLVAYYEFVNGSLTDLSGQDNDLINFNVTTTLDRKSGINDAMNFDSQSDYLIVNNPSFKTNTKGTFVAWVKFTSVDHTQYAASAGDEGSIESYISFFRLDPVKHVFGIYQRESGLANWVEGSTVVQAGQYYHLVMHSDGFNWTIYINGVKEELTVRQGSNTGKWIGQLSSIDNFVVGSSVILQPYTIPNFSGVIDHVLMYDRALEECEITALYNDSKPLVQ